MALKMSAERHPPVTARVTGRLQGAATVSRQSERTAGGLTAQRCDAGPIQKCTIHSHLADQLPPEVTMLRVSPNVLAACLMAIALAGCRDAAGPKDALRARSAKPTTDVTAPLAPLVLHTIAPQATDIAINIALAPHYVWLDTTARGNPKLLVFMPGTNNTPANWQLLEKEAARVGYHVIGLMYQNDVEVVGKCGGSADANTNTDPNCSEKMRLEIVDGVDRGTNVSVSPANSIDNRLTKLLVYLDREFPEEGWSRFLDADVTPKWSQIAVSGQSQGAGQAALIGTIRKVDRVVWEDLVIPGYARPFPHQSTARDNNTPLDADGTPRLRDAWRYLLGAPAREDEDQ